MSRPLLGRSGVPIPVGAIFSSVTLPYRLRGPSSLLFNGYRGSFPGVKRPGREADHSPPSSVEVSGAAPHLPPYGLMTWTGTASPLYFFGVCLSTKSVAQII